MSVAILINDLKQIPDWRRGREVQHPLWLMLLMTLLGVMSGYSSLRGLADFMKRHQQEVADYFGLKRAKLPSYSTLRDMAMQVDLVAVEQVFGRWTTSHEVPAGTGVALDGKALGSTVQDCQGAEQNFVMMVSACVHQRGDVIAQTPFENGQQSEIGVVQALLKQLDCHGVWYTADALHCQKNRASNRHE